MSEHQEQVAVCQYLDVVYPDVLYFSVPNGASLTNAGRQMNKLKAEGLLPGVSDLIIFEPRGQYSCMFLEMKTLTGKPSEVQQWFIRQVEARGAFGTFAYGADDAIKAIDIYLNLGVSENKDEKQEV